MNQDEAAAFSGETLEQRRDEFTAQWDDQTGSFYRLDEGERRLKYFWGDSSPFRKLFERLDLTNVIDIGCGHGAQEPPYIDRAGRVTLVDAAARNVEFCRQRFGDGPKFAYYANNGYNLSELPDSDYTAAFSYGTMFYFEMFDVYSYLQDIYRVLKPGGRALLHHSNYDRDYRATWMSQSSVNRAFMSKNLFAYLASHVGFKVLEQVIVDKAFLNSDCLTLLEKPPTQATVITTERR